jgi:hypothetical protein
LFALYIAAVTLVKSLERKPHHPLAFVFLTASLVTPLHAPASVVFRPLTAVMLALGVIYAEKEKKQA